MSTSSLFVPANSFSADSSLGFSAPKVNNAGGKNVNLLNTDTRKGLVLSSPLMLTWGLNEFKDEASGKCSYDLSLQFPSDNYPNPQASEWLEKLKEYESKIKATAVEKCKEWFNKPTMSPDVVDALWTPMLRYKKGSDGMPDESSAPTLRIKIPFWQGEWKCEIYDMDDTALYPNDKDVTPMDLVPKLTNVAMIIQSGGVWFANGKFGTTWKLIQAKVKPRASLRGKCHIALSVDEREKLDAQKDTEDDHEPTQVVDSDDDEEPTPPGLATDTSAAESESAAESAPPLKQKRVIKKKIGGE